MTWALFRVGASGAWLSPDSAFVLGIDTHEIRLEVSDQSIVHHAYVPLCLPFVGGSSPGELSAPPNCYPHDPYYGGGLRIYSMECEIGGDSWTGAPTHGTQLVLHSSSGGTLASVGDSTVPATMNGRHTFRTPFSLSPLVVDPLATYMLEIQSPDGGTGSGRKIRIYGVNVRYLADVGP